MAMAKDMVRTLLSFCSLLRVCGVCENDLSTAMTDGVDLNS